MRRSPIPRHRSAGSAIYNIDVDPQEMRTRHRYRPAPPAHLSSNGADLTCAFFAYLPASDCAYASAHLMRLSDAAPDSQRRKANRFARRLTSMSKTQARISGICKPTHDSHARERVSQFDPNIPTSTHVNSRPCASRVHLSTQLSKPLSKNQILAYS